MSIENCLATHPSPSGATCVWYYNATSNLGYHRERGSAFQGGYSGYIQFSFGTFLS